MTRQFPAVAEAVSRVGARTAVIDGEIVPLDADGRPSFQALHHWSTAGLSIVYYAFDLLHLNGRDLTRSPLDERRAALRDIIGDSGVWLSEPLPGTPDQIAAAVRRLGLEGSSWTRDGSLRHAAFLGLRDDKRPRDVHKE